MRRENGLDQITRDERSVVTVGTFDGVHRGHQALVHYLIERAAARAGRSTVISFDPHPRTVVRGDQVPLLTTPEERADLLETLGLDRFIVVPFTKAFSNLRAKAYVEDFLVGRVGLQEIVVGHDHRFGSDRAGDAALLKRMGQALEFSVDVISAQEVEPYGVVSSSAVREVLLEKGDVQRARELLGRSYALSGRVERGEGRGRKLGFPTANLAPQDPRKLVPRQGVYAVRAQLPGDSTLRGGMMNIGRRPTFGGEEERLEVHLLDFEGDLYDRMLRIEFVRKLREERSFDGVEALKEQLSEDRRRCKSILDDV